MAFIASPAQLAILQQSVDEYCRDCNLTESNERLYVAEVVSVLFERGATSPNDIRRGLELAIGPCRAA